MGWHSDTAAHAIDPATPGAAESILNLGDCLREEILIPRRGEIAEIMAENKRFFARAYRYLAAAKPLTDEAASLLSAPAGEAEMARLARLWARDLDAAGWAARPGRVRRLFAEGITPAGRVRTVERLGAQECWRVTAPWGADTASFMDTLAEAVTRSGQDAEYLMQPMDDGRIGHLYIPGRRLLVTVLREGDAPLGILGSRTLDLGAYAADRSLPDGLRETAEDLIARAVEALRDAKTVHDALEARYRDAMDFGTAAHRAAAAVARALEGV